MDSDGCRQDHVNFSINANKANQIKRKYSIDDRVCTPQMVYNNNKKKKKRTRTLTVSPFPNNSAINRNTFGFHWIKFQPATKCRHHFSHTICLFFVVSLRPIPCAILLSIRLSTCNILMWRRHFIFRQIKFDRLDLTFSLSAFIVKEKKLSKAARICE